MPKLIPLRLKEADECKLEDGVRSSYRSRIGKDEKLEKLPKLLTSDLGSQRQNVAEHGAKAARGPGPLITWCPGGRRMRAAQTCHLFTLSRSSEQRVEVARGPHSLIIHT